METTELQDKFVERLAEDGLAEALDACDGEIDLEPPEPEFDDPEPSKYDDDDDNFDYDDTDEFPWC